MQFAKAVEPYRLFFIEDPLAPEDIAYFRQIRQQCATPIAMGELFNSPHEWTPLISERLIDYIRIHVSEAGGFTPCRKIAAMGEISECARRGMVRATFHRSDTWQTSHWMSSATTSASRNIPGFNDALQEVFHGCPVVEEWVHVSESLAGLGN